MGLALYNYSKNENTSFSSSFLSNPEEEKEGSGLARSACQHYCTRHDHPHSDFYQPRRRSRHSRGTTPSTSDDEDDDYYGYSQCSQDSIHSRDGRLTVDSQQRGRRPPSLERQDAFWDAKTVKRRSSGGGNKRSLDELDITVHLDSYREAKRTRRIREMDVDMEMDEEEEKCYNHAIIRVNEWAIEEVISRVMMEDDINPASGAVP